MQRDARARGELGAHPVVLQGDGVIARLGVLTRVAEARGVAAAGMLRVAALQAHRPGNRHQQHVPQVRVAGAREVRVGEADDGVILVAVARRPAVGLLARPDLRVRAHLHHAEGHHRARKGVTVAGGADERIDGREGIGGAGGSGRGRERGQCQRQRAAQPAARGGARACRRCHVPARPPVRVLDRLLCRNHRRPRCVRRRGHPSTKTAVITSQPATDCYRWLQPPPTCR